MGKFKELAIVLEDLKRMRPIMKLRFDVYNNSVVSAVTAFEVLETTCASVTLSKQKRYNSDKYHYNVYGDVDTADISILHDAFGEVSGWVDSASDLD